MMMSRAVPAVCRNPKGHASNMAPGSRHAFVAPRQPGSFLPNLLATVAGNLFELKQVSGLRLLDLRLPEGFADSLSGAEVWRRGHTPARGRRDGPLIGTIIKPSVGLGPEDTAAMTKTLCEAGIDFIKDDELQSDGPSCPFDDRVRAVMPSSTTMRTAPARR